ncbi:signal transduction histidine kinase [Stackebrandtia endophytica]|uniref:histidine kinase n=1 Tax=Stackebrandtia endophytica TaxID=1496996 RepID=A0A543AV70_9ACTN|nr:sensor histidine kinase [Stackebrandtia endophytica]TQL76480.1 signal transduction histidine kinase [Stackebrandtia endophytica]
MPRPRPRTALAAVLWPRLPLSSWPWRSAGYLIATMPVALAAITVLGVPWLILAVKLATGGMPLVDATGLILVGVAVIAVVGPLVAAPLADLERRRLHLVDTRPLDAPATETGGPLERLRARYGDPRAWREVGYVCLLATVTPVLIGVLATVVLLAGSFVASPFLVMAQGPGNTPVALGFSQITTVEQSTPYVVAGLGLIVLLPYLVTLVAGGHGAAARTLLTGGSGRRLRAELIEVSQSRTRLVNAFEAERRRIERDLHDGAQQRLVSLTLKLGLARLDLPPDSPAATVVGEAHDQAKQLMAELRELIHGIQPQILTDLGLGAAIEELAESAPIPVDVDTTLDRRLPGPIENTAYFVVSEALTNVAKHSGATEATVRTRHHDDLLTVEIGDNGHGGADPVGGTGLTGLADRVAVTGGRMLLSSPIGGPTVLCVEVPCGPSPRPSE